MRTLMRGEGVVVFQPVPLLAPEDAPSLAVASSILRRMVTVTYAGWMLHCGIA